MFDTLFEKHILKSYKFRDLRVPSSGTTVTYE